MKMKTKTISTPAIYNGKKVDAEITLEVLKDNNGNENINMRNNFKTFPVSLNMFIEAVNKGLFKFAFPSKNDKEDK